MGDNSSLKEEQLKAAMEMQEMGIDPDQIMVTYTPEEFHEMYNGPEDVHFELTEENIDAFPISLLGCSSVLRGYDLSVNAFGNPFNQNIVDLYNRTIRKALTNADECDYSVRQLVMQIDIQSTLDKAIAAALAYYMEEFEADERAYESAINTMQKAELASDMRRSKMVVDRVVFTKNGNDDLTKFLQELLYDIRER